MIPSLLLEEVANLKKVGYHISLKEEGNQVFIIFRDFILPINGYNQANTDLLIWTGTNYPSCAFDMFWVDENLLLSDNKVPKNAEIIQILCKKKWRRFSIHPYSQRRWNPSKDNLEIYLSYINKRLNHLI